MQVSHALGVDTRGTEQTDAFLDNRRSRQRIGGAAAVIADMYRSERLMSDDARPLAMDAVRQPAVISRRSRQAARASGILRWKVLDNRS